MVYLDHNASTPLLPEALDAMLPFLTTHHANPSSSHASGRMVRSALDSARAQVCEDLNAPDHQLIITSGATEANTLALLGYKAGRRIISAGEHDSVWEAAHATHQPVIWPLMSDGRLDWDRAPVLMPGDLVSVMVVNNEFGTCYPLAEICAYAHAQGALVHTDATQALGKCAVDVMAMGVDALTGSAHKMGGPKGVGFLLLKSPHLWSARTFGGAQEFDLRAGTEPVAAMMGLAAALRAVTRSLPTRQQHFSLLQQSLEQALVAEGAIILGQAGPRVGNTTMFIDPNLDGDMLRMQLDKCGVAVSSGAACRSQTPGDSRILRALGLTAEQAQHVLRVSTGIDTTAEHITTFLTAYRQIHQKWTRREVIQHVG
ncbi:MAG: cysteine desulfurase family protein [Pseudomonadota bacterium]